jgi:O-antigen ligase
VGNRLNQAHETPAANLPQAAFIARPLAIGLMVYLVMLGATFNGVVIYSISALTIGLTVLIVAVWLIARTIRGWQWPPWPVWAVPALWLLAILLSMLANPETLRRQEIGLWFVVAYCLVWLALNDLLRNHWISRARLMDAYLVAMSVAIGFGYLHTISALLQGSGLIRPGSIVGNPNAYGALLSMAALVVIGRLTADTSVGARRLYWAYLVALAVQLALTQSRGAWLGFGAGLVLLAALRAADLELSWKAVRAAWADAAKGRRRLWVSILLLGFAAIGVVAAQLVHSFLFTGGRTLDLRLYIWESAIRQFLDAPLFGQGLFTFGRDLALAGSIPPLNPHSHAHSIPLNVLAELGVLGAGALVASIVFALVRLRDQWRSGGGGSRLDLALAAAAACAFAFQHLVDLPAMMPVVLLGGMLFFAMITAYGSPGGSVARKWPWLGGALGAGVIFWALLGARSASLSQEVLLAAQMPVVAGDDTLEQLIAADDRVAAHLITVGYALAVAAAREDAPDLLEQAAAMQARLTAIEPTYSPGWANLAGLRWHQGREEEAIALMAEAVALAPDFRPYQVTLAHYAGQVTVEAVRGLNWDNQYIANYWTMQWLRFGPERAFVPQLTAMGEN